MSTIVRTGISCVLGRAARHQSSVEVAPKRGCARMAGLKLSLVQALSLQLSDSHHSFMSLSFFSWTQGKGPHLFTRQGQCERRWGQVCKSGVCEGLWWWKVPGTLVWGRLQTWMGPPPCGCAPRWKQLPIASHRHSGWKKVVMQVKQGCRLRWCQVVVRRGAAGGRVACEVGDGPFLIRQKEC